MWVYRQSTGVLRHNDEPVDSGYSGFGTGRNNPASQDVVNVGPLPRGLYYIGAPQDVAVPGPHGPYVLPLAPLAGTPTLGRGGFLIHGDAVDHPGAASHGCLVFVRPTRERIGKSGDPYLVVVA